MGEEKTNMDGVRRVACALLNTDLTLFPDTPGIASHPFTNSGMVGVPTEDGGISILDIGHDEKALRSWREAVGKAIMNAKSPKTIYFMLHPSYALTYLKYAGDFMTVEDFSAILGQAWTGAENANEDKIVSQAEQIKMFKRADPVHLMTASELAFFKSLPEEMVVFRGTEEMFEHEAQALSWSLDHAVAQWFANRFNNSGHVYQASINRRYVLAYFDRRKESEIVLDPAHLADMKCIA